jgi:hypothetical protein
MDAGAGEMAVAGMTRVGEIAIVVRTGGRGVGGRLSGLRDLPGCCQSAMGFGQVRSRAFLSGSPGTPASCPQTRCCARKMLLLQQFSNTAAATD